MSEEINIEDIKKATLSIQKMKESELPKGFRWFTRLMARFGWHRQYEILIFDKSQFGYDIFLNKPIELITPAIKAEDKETE